MKKNVAVILAAGSGKRAGTHIPKQFLECHGKMVIAYTVAAFNRNAHIDDIIVVAEKSWHEAIRNALAEYSKVTRVIEGGKERYHSSIAAINACEGIDCNLLIHDAARPFVSQRIIDDVSVALQSFKAVNVAIPATDTIIETDESHRFIARIPDRTRLFHVQTPQGFDSRTLQHAYVMALASNFQPTDDCSVVRTFLPDEPINLVEGEKRNIKITWNEDLALLEKLEE